MSADFLSVISIVFLAKGAIQINLNFCSSYIFLGIQRKQGFLLNYHAPPLNNFTQKVSKETLDVSR